MEFLTELIDALYVNWAVPVEQLPSPPELLQLDRVIAGGVETGFVTLVLFRQRGLRLAGWPPIELGFRQCNLRLPSRDADRVASIWLLRQVVPAWVVPFGRLVARQPLHAARLRNESGSGEGGVRWRVHAEAELALTASPGGNTAATPSVGGWEQLVAFFRERPRGYFRQRGELCRIEAAFEQASGLPQRVEIESAGWLERQLPLVPPELWRRPHSAFLVESTRLALARSRVPESTVAGPVPARGVPA